MCLTARCAMQPSGDVKEPQAPYPFVRASFINALSEEGTREELVRYLQEQWNETCAVRSALRSAISRLAEQEREFNELFAASQSKRAEFEAKYENGKFRTEKAEARVAVLEKALRECRGLFSDIRNDWTDPRSECRKGWEIIHAALSTGAGEEK